MEKAIVNAADALVTITKAEYDELLKDQKKLVALEGAGVDNWCGYDDAMAILREMKNEI